MAELHLPTLLHVIEGDSARLWLLKRSKLRMSIKERNKLQKNSSRGRPPNLSHTERIPLVSPPAIYRNHRYDTFDLKANRAVRLQAQAASQNRHFLLGNPLVRIQLPLKDVRLHLPHVASLTKTKIRMAISIKDL